MCRAFINDTWFLTWHVAFLEPEVEHKALTKHYTRTLGDGGVAVVPCRGSGPAGPLTSHLHFRELLGPGVCGSEGDCFQKISPL